MSPVTPDPSPLNPREFTSLLKGTSRSFYITLRLLPAAIRPQIGLAYLMARATDTIADTDAVSVPDRLEALDQMRQRVLGSSAPFPADRFVGKSGMTSASASGSELQLLNQFDRVISLLNSYSSSDQELIRSVLSTIVSGQELDLKRFTSASKQNVISLKSLEETEDYTHRVAGCVGEFWTRCCTHHLFRNGEWNEADQLRDGVRFGRGLQWVNILRDLPRDLRQGRCYLPSQALARVNLKPSQLLEPAMMSSLRPLFETLLRHAEAHLDSGWTYTQSIPRKQRRLRVACAVPVLIGWKTLSLLRHENPLDPNRRIKVSRAIVRQCVLQSTLASWGILSWKALKAWGQGFRSD